MVTVVNPVLLLLWEKGRMVIATMAPGSAAVCVSLFSFRSVRQRTTLSLSL